MSDAGGGPEESAQQRKRVLYFHDERIALHASVEASLVQRKYYSKLFATRHGAAPTTEPPSAFGAGPLALARCGLAAGGCSLRYDK